MRHTAVPPAHSTRGRRCAAFAATVALFALMIVARGDARPMSTSTAAALASRQLTTPAIKVHEPAVPPVPVSEVALAALPAATTFADLPQAPLDPAPQQAPVGVVVHPHRLVPIYATPGGPPIASLPPTQLVSDTWLPVIAERAGWVQVLLPSRPNGATGWLATTEQVTVATTPYRIIVDRAAFSLTLLRDEQPVGTWRVGIGKANSPTPPGRTFLLASFTESTPTYSPVIIPLGTHSTTYTSYAGGPGTVGIHTWPTATVYGTASSDGCVRIPPDALQIVSTEVPLGTPVLIQ